MTIYKITKVYMVPAQDRAEAQAKAAAAERADELYLVWQGVLQLFVQGTGHQLNAWLTTFKQQLLG